MQQDKLDKFAVKLLEGSYVFGVIIFIIILGYQIYKWAKIGVWVSLPFSKSFEFINIDLSFIYYPSDWRGLAKVCEWILNLPLSICLPLFIIFICFVFKALITAKPD
jgi:hypothetical protein